MHARCIIITLMCIKLVVVVSHHVLVDLLLLSVTIRPTTQHGDGIGITMEAWVSSTLLSF